MNDGADRRQVRAYAGLACAAAVVAVAAIYAAGEAWRLLRSVEDIHESVGAYDKIGKAKPRRMGGQ